jgi:cyclophilin family peptidyl-prolyl cis-trans isomerase
MRSSGLLRFAVPFALSLALGCNKAEDANSITLPEDPTPVAPAAVTPHPGIDPRWQQSFADATRAEPVADWRPPEMTLTGKSVGKLYLEVQKLWDSTRLANDAGKLRSHKAILETSQGDIEITLRPDWAPNHVRNFLTLIRAGYYDGLVFERVHREESEAKDTLELIEGGCPLGTGETGSGSIGYWLKPEFNADAKHEEGTVGAVRDAEEDTTACRFYITLSKAPLLDGNFTAFGQVTRGLDIVRKISVQPVRQDEEAPSGSWRPVVPVVILKVIIVSTG